MSSVFLSEFTALCKRPIELVSGNRRLSCRYSQDAFASWNVYEGQSSHWSLALTTKFRFSFHRKQSFRKRLAKLIVKSGFASVNKWEKNVACWLHNIEPFLQIIMPVNLILCWYKNLPMHANICFQKQISKIKTVKWEGRHVLTELHGILLLVCVSQSWPLSRCCWGHYVFFMRPFFLYSL